MGNLCMERVDSDVFFSFLANYNAIASEPDSRMMKFTGKYSGECVGRIVYGEEHKRYYINTATTEPEITIIITDAGVVQRGVATR